jgi:hypothetical protein
MLKLTLFCYIKNERDDRKMGKFEGGISMWITDEKIFGVGNKLIKRCNKIKENLIKLPKILKSIPSFYRIRAGKNSWNYHPLRETKTNNPNKLISKYHGLHAINLSNNDRLIFSTVVYDWEVAEEFIVIELLFHYLDDLTAKEIATFKDDDKELYELLLIYRFDEQLKTRDRVLDAYYSKYNDETRLWLFEI